MAPPSLLLLRLLLRPSTSCYSYMSRKARHLPCAKSFSSSPEPLWQPDPGPPLTPTPPPPPSSDAKAGLSARMSFVFDQIDAMERARGAKDEALQRIRAWRQTKQHQQQQEQRIDGADGDGDARGIGLEAMSAAEVGGSQVAEEKGMMEQEGRNVFKKDVELVHPWPEWIELMELLVKQNYFDHRRFNEDQAVKDLSIDLSGIAEDVGFDFTRDWATVRTACLNFGRDRFDILRSLSRKDLQILVGNGCPTTDKKVVFSAKLLRKHAHLDEGDVCSACKLRSTCSSGYLPTRKEDEARTLDVMRVLLTFAFEPITGSVENKALMKLKSLKTVIRKLLHDIVRLGAVPIDPNLPLPVIKRPPPKVKQPPPPPKKRVGRDDVEMKKGDWLCPKCDFMNFAKNVVCLQCDSKRPKRQLLPGEWECPECNFLNYRRNMACFHCDHKRPPDEFTENRMQFKQEGPQRRLDRTAGLSNVSNGWNFDFDDNESDGADVAAFEFADPPRMNDGSLDGPHQRDVSRGFEDGFSEANSTPRSRDSRNLSEPDEKAFSHVPRTGFDDFDEEDDDVDSYEIDNQPANPIRAVSPENMSKFEDSAGSEDFDNFESGYKHHVSCNAASSGSGDDDDQNIDSESGHTNHPQWKSFKKRAWTSGGNNQNRGMSDDDLGLDSDFDDNTDLEFSSKQRRGVRHDSRARGFERMRNSVSDDFVGSKSEDYGYLHSNGKKMQGNRGNRNMRGNRFKEFDHSDSAINQNFKMGNGRGNRGISFGNTRDVWPYGGPSRRTRGARDNGDHIQRGKNEKYDFQRLDEPRQRRFEYRQGGISNQFNDRSRYYDEYKQGISNQFNDRSRHSDEYRQRGRSNQWNSRSTGF